MVSALLGVLALFAIFAYVFMRSEGLALLAPKRTLGITASAQGYCTDHCRTPDGLCPLTDSKDPATDCPLWKFVDADVPTAAYGNPFSHLQVIRRA